ncbi:MAG: response regulator, partial [Acidobacteriia bacterium]|nr:response regulator [Terriglobia bacterium]
ISDTGRGMDRETRERIFEPFFTTKERGKRTGMGLATVYGMVKQSGGDIWVYSEPGKGTTFKLYFPKFAEDRTKAAAITPERIRAATDETVTVLVVEDEKPVRQLTVRMLQKLGYSVLSAGSGEEALAVSDSFAGRIALLITDVVMPQMSGREVSDVLKSKRPDMKVLFLSGYTENVMVLHGVDSDANFLAKPFSSETLSKKLEEIACSSGTASR